MLKYLLLLAYLLGGAMAASSIGVQTELYIVAGILGGACLLLTIAAIYNSVTIISLQTKVAVLQAAGTAAVKAVSEAVERSPPPMAGKPTEPLGQYPYGGELPSTRKPTEPLGQYPYGGELPSTRKPTEPVAQNPYGAEPPRTRDPYEQRHAREDPYRRQDSRNSYNMDRQPPSRPHQDDRRPPAGYY